MAVENVEGRNNNGIARGEIAELAPVKGGAGRSLHVGQNERK
jgi:hypothetical protein